MSATTHQDPPLARWALRLCALWLATGALAKLFLGTPLLLPALIREHTPLSLNLTYTLVIGVEFALVALCFLRPRQAWPLMLALFVFFDLVLTTQIAAGEKSCGCFGDGPKISPKLMMAADSAFLLGLLATKPWASLRSRGAGIGLVLGAFVLAFAMPAFKIHERTSGTLEKPPEFVELDPKHWVGRNVYEIEELTRWVPAEKLPTDGQIVLWRQGCEHCARHLRELANGDKGEHPIVMIQIQDDLESSREVDAMPEGAHVSHFQLPKGMKLVLQTPWDVTVAGGDVTAAVDPATLDPEQH
jgi:Methylamine utilisation protein MauE